MAMLHHGKVVKFAAEEGSKFKRVQTERNVAFRRPLSLHSTLDCGRLNFRPSYTRKISASTLFGNRIFRVEVLVRFSFRSPPKLPIVSQVYRILPEKVLFHIQQKVCPKIPFITEEVSKLRATLTPRAKLPHHTNVLWL